MKDPAWMRDKLHALAIEADEMLGSCDASDILDTLEEARNAMTEGAETIARLMVELAQAKRERDALLEYLENSIRPCSLCKYDAPDAYDICRDCENESHWEWRGVQEVTEDGEP